MATAPIAPQYGPAEPEADEDQDLEDDNKPVAKTPEVIDDEVIAKTVDSEEDDDADYCSAEEDGETNNGRHLRHSIRAWIPPDHHIEIHMLNVFG